MMNDHDLIEPGAARRLAVLVSHVRELKADIAALRSEAATLNSSMDRMVDGIRADLSDLRTLSNAQLQALHWLLNLLAAPPPLGDAAAGDATKDGVEAEPSTAAAAEQGTGDPQESRAG